MFKKSRNSFWFYLLPLFWVAVFLAAFFSFGTAQAQKLNPGCAPRDLNVETSLDDNTGQVVAKVTWKNPTITTCKEYYPWFGVDRKYVVKYGSDQFNFAGARNDITYSGIYFVKSGVTKIDVTTFINNVPVANASQNVTNPASSNNKYTVTDFEVIPVENAGKCYAKIKFNAPADLPASATKNTEFQITIGKMAPFKKPYAASVAFDKEVTCGLAQQYRIDTLVNGVTVGFTIKTAQVGNGATQTPPTNPTGTAGGTSGGTSSSAQDPLTEACKDTNSWLSKIPIVGGAASWLLNFLNPIKAILCVIISFFENLIQGILDNIISHLAPSAPQQFRPGGEYYSWLIQPWRICLGLVDAFVVLVLLFLAIVNIAHINYDTYQLKKSLPLLIVGIIMAHFSLLICQMIITVSEVLLSTATGGGQVTGTIIQPLIWGLGIGPVLNASGGMKLFALIWALNPNNMAFFLIMSFLMLLVVLIAVSVLIFLLYIRLAILIFLFITAPLAFVSLGFPPTTGMFKKWWSEFTKWVFMKPIMFFVFRIAAVIGTVNSNNDTSAMALWMITVALTYLAFTVPFKLGGAAMGAWSRFGKMIGLTATAPIRKAAGEWAGTQVKDAKLAAGNWFFTNTAFGRRMSDWQANQRNRSRELADDRKEIETNANRRLRNRNPEIVAREQRRRDAETQLEAEDQIRERDFFATAEGERIHNNMMALEAAKLENQEQKDTLKRTWMEGAHGQAMIERKIRIQTINKDISAREQEVYNTVLRGPGGVDIVRAEYRAGTAAENVKAALEEAKRDPALSGARRGLVVAQIRAEDQAGLTKRENDLTRGRIYRSGAGASLIQNEVLNSQAAARTEQARTDQMTAYYRANGRELADFEGAIANSQKQLEKVKADYRDVHSHEKLNQHGQLTQTFTALADLYKRRDAAEQRLAMARTPTDRTTAETDLRDLARDITAQIATDRAALTTQINPNTGSNYTAAEAEQFLRNSYLRTYEKTRYYSISAARMAEDISVDARSKAANNATSSLMQVDPATGAFVFKDSSYGPYSAQAADGVKFFNGQRLSNPSASACIMSNLGMLREQMGNFSTMGEALTEYSKILQAGNAAALEEGLTAAYDSLDKQGKDDVNAMLTARGISGGATPANLTQLVTRHSLNTSSQGGQRDFASFLISSLKKMDGRKDPTTGKMDVTGLGQSYWWYAQNL